ncbi:MULTISPECIES: ABC transporter substrate-binding protein [Rhodomicrobium]|uniref:ABC transporter substrate-binding protein n=1 Tax=Rhodomicrobium TaxID=1068 RepID=UPI000B4C1643|nr:MULTISPECIES: ABC transporter substrate-binding protein [Rhodomicrobium]
MTRHRLWTLALAAAFAAALSATGAGAQDKPVRVGYWTSGFSLGFGAVLQEEKFLEKEGLKSQFRTFSEVGAPAQAVLSGDVDIAFGAPVTAGYNLAVQGAPVRIILVTQILEGQIVVPVASPIQAVAELKGKRIGMSRPGSATHALATAILSANYGIEPDGYKIIPGNEGQLTQLLQRGDLDAAILRRVTIVQLPKDTVRPLADIVAEWKTLTKTDETPALAVALTTADFLEKNPDAAVKVVKAIQKAVKFGSENKPRVAEILQSVANLAPEDATSYASVWEAGYTATLSPAAIAGLKRENEIFVKAGAAEAIAPDWLYADGPYKAATQQ